MKTAYVGIDVSKDQLDIFVINGVKHSKRIFENNVAGIHKCSTYLDSIGAFIVKVALEPTGRYGEALADKLSQRPNTTVFEINPLKIKRYASALNPREKSDEKDSIALAKFCKEHAESLTPRMAKSQTQLELRDLQMRLRSLTKRIVSLKNQQQCGLYSEFVADEIARELEFCEQAYAKAETRAEEIVKAQPRLMRNVQILNSISGIGYSTALKLVCLVDFGRFKTGQAFAAFLGLTNKKEQSGKMRTRETVSKAGNKHIRAALYWPSQVAIIHNPQMREFANRLTSRGKPNYTVRAAVARKMMVLAWLLIKRQCFYDPDYVGSKPVA
jgi:transposase